MHTPKFQLSCHFKVKHPLNMKASADYLLLFLWFVLAFVGHFRLDFNQQKQRLKKSCRKVPAFPFFGQFAARKIHEMEVQLL